MNLSTMSPQELKIIAASYEDGLLAPEGREEFEQQALQSEEALNSLDNYFAFVKNTLEPPQILALNPETVDEFAPMPITGPLAMEAASQAQERTESPVSRIVSLLGRMFQSKQSFALVAMAAAAAFVFMIVPAGKQPVVETQMRGAHQVMVEIKDQEILANGDVHFSWTVPEDGGKSELSLYNDTFQKIGSWTVENGGESTVPAAHFVEKHTYRWEVVWTKGGSTHRNSASFAYVR